MEMETAEERVMVVEKVEKNNNDVTYFRNGEMDLYERTYL